MYILKTESSFDSAHFLADYEGKCANIHGHRWRVIVEIKSETLKADGQTRGMVEDFGDFKQDLKDLADRLDHRLIYEEGTLRSKTVEALTEEGFAMMTVPFRPTAENFSKFVYDKMTEQGYHVHSATVYETPNNCAVYTE